MKRFIFLLACINLQATTLKEDVADSLKTNPVIKERLRNFRATKQDVNIATSEYLPSIDLRTVVSYNKAGDDNTAVLHHDVKDTNYELYQATLTLTQNIFNGFSTKYKVKYQETRVLAAAYNYIEKANDISFKMANAYINVLETYEQVKISRENVKITEAIYKKVKNLYESGLTTDSEVKKIQSSLSLAYSNLTVEKNNALDAQYNYRRILGRMPNISEMEKPTLDVEIPDSIEKTALFAVNNNPSLLVSKYNIDGAYALKKQREGSFYPKIDFELSKTYKDTFSATNGFDSPDDRFKASVILTYNLYKGGADKAESQKNISKINQEVEIKRDLKRQVIEGLDLSWSAYDMIGKQLVDLREYATYSEKTLELYREEYDLGRRSLLDLLSSQNDVINAKSQIVSAEYKRLFAKYRILDAMGILVKSLAGDNDILKSNVELDENSKEVLDSIEINKDRDEDKLIDDNDLCANSLTDSNIEFSGCVDTKKSVVDLDYSDYDNDGVKDSIDKCPKTPKNYKVDEFGCTSVVNLSINFSSNSSEVPQKDLEKLSDFSEFLKENKALKFEIIGHTSKTKVSNRDYNLKLSKNRALAIKKLLVIYGIDEKRLIAIGKGFDEPIADNSTKDGRYKNRRIEMKLIED